MGPGGRAGSGCRRGVYSAAVPRLPFDGIAVVDEQQGNTGRRSSMAEHRTCNAGGVGSIPTAGSRASRGLPPKVRGELTEVEVSYALHRAGYDVLIAPFSDNLRYDCVIDDGERLLRVQIKTARLEKGCLTFATASTDWYRHRRRSYHGEADVFAVYYPPADQVYLVPVDACPRTAARLRVEPVRNGQSRRIRWAKGFELKPRGERGPDQVKERPSPSPSCPPYGWSPRTGLTKVNCGLTL